MNKGLDELAKLKKWLIEDTDAITANLDELNDKTDKANSEGKKKKFKGLRKKLKETFGIKGTEFTCPKLYYALDKTKRLG